MIYFFIAYVLSFVLFAYEEYCEWMEGWDKNELHNWDVREHIISMLHRLSLILAGYFYPFGWIELPLLLGVYWLMTDGLMNLMKKRNFFAVSLQSGNPFEKWNVVKFSLVIVGAVLIMLYRFK